ncbi:alpha/beta hydrolase [Amycolatopsis sp. WQ 127309]|uniref:alpha/beta hydrolase n=1 Tax=Amycolatopsis sp. WQ 127309 TaxID=2932773 RepID=UPI001FF3E635|nr:alpha/beta hydrolase [Amycolatopsis sp. WQ 127309]UOZ04086.1 alpha/beta hydrolase [Amycolatopsis sp. WQ 127309]
MTFRFESVSESTLDQMRGINAQLAAADLPDPTTAEGLAVMRGTTFQVPAATELVPTDRRVSGPAGEATVRIIRPAGPVTGVVFHVHGGGFVLGAPADDDAINDLLARTAGVAVVSTRYRLAPEHTFPAPIEDCLAAAVWLAGAVEEEFGTDRIVVSGYSAGGNLAAHTLLLLRDGFPELFGRVVGASLVFGVYDLSRTPSSRSATPDTPVLPPRWLDQFVGLAFPGLDKEKLRDGGISPLYADLHGMPPALFTVGERDPLLDDSLFMAARWRAAGGRSELAVWPESPHGFVGMTPPTGLPAQHRINAWVKALLSEKQPAE